MRYLEKILRYLEKKNEIEYLGKKVGNFFWKYI